MSKTESEEKIDIENQDKLANKIQAFSAKKLQGFVKRINVVMSQMDDCKSDLKEILLEAHGLGFDKKALKQVAKEEREEKDDREHQWELLSLYRSAMGMLDGTPLGDFAAKHEEENAGKVVEITVANGRAVTTKRTKKVRQDEMAADEGISN